MKKHLFEFLIGGEELKLLESLLGTTIVGFDFNPSGISYNYNHNNFSFHWPTNLVLISYNGSENQVNLNIGNQLILDDLGGETNNIKISRNEESYLNKPLIYFYSLTIRSIEIYVNEREYLIGILDNDTKSKMLLSKYETKELKVIKKSDGLILMKNEKNEPLLIQADESMNGEILLHFNKSRIDSICQNSLENYGYRTNFQRRVILE